MQLKRPHKKGLYFLLFLLVVAACSVSPKPLSDWERAVRVDRDVRSIFSSERQAEIERSLTLYEAMAQALKHNLNRRLKIMEQAVAKTKMDIVGVEMLPKIVAGAGFASRNNTLAISSQEFGSSTNEEYRKYGRRESGVANLQMAWNILDFGLSYYQAQQDANRVLVAQERRRKVIHNLLQEVRSSYWKVLTAQRVKPDLDALIEESTYVLEDLKTAEAKETDEAKHSEILQKQAKLIEDIRKMRDLQLEFELAPKHLAELMGVMPSTKFKLVGDEEGNFKLPRIKARIARVEWLALMNRPELREEDYQIQISRYETRKAVFGMFPEVSVVGSLNYDDNPFLFNRSWSDIAFKMGWNLLNPARIEMQANLARARENEANLRRQALSMGVVTQVHIAWGRYNAARDNYELAVEYADVINKIAERVAAKKMDNDVVSQADAIFEGAKSLLARAERDLAFADLEDAAGDVFVTVGLDPFPEEVTNYDIPTLARAIQNVMSAWNLGNFTPEDNPLNIPAPRTKPAVYVGKVLPDVNMSEAETLIYEIPATVFDMAQLGGDVFYTASLKDGSPLPHWLYFDKEALVLSGNPGAGYIGYNQIIVRSTNAKGLSAWTDFAINVRRGYAYRMEIRGAKDGNKVMVMEPCAQGLCEDFPFRGEIRKTREVVITPTVKRR